MTDELDILKQVERVEPPEHLLVMIRERLVKQDKIKVPISWIRGIAAAFALLLAVEGFFLTNRQLGPKTAQHALTQILPQGQNKLYDE